MEINKSLYDDIHKFLDKISNSVGETITEYHWREACGLIKELDETVQPDERLRIPDYVRNSNNDIFKGKTFYNSYIDKLVWEVEDNHGK